MRSFAALAVLAITLQGLLGLDFGDTFDKVFGLQRHRRDVGDGKTCTFKSFEGALSCCKLPDVVPKDSLSKCFGQTAKRKTKKGAKRIPGMSFACTVDCALRKNDVILESGHANVAKLEESFLEKSNDDWDPIVRAAFSKCNEELDKANITEEGECKLKNLHLVYCLFQYAIANCPAKSIPETAKGCESKTEVIKTCDPWAVMKDVESTASSVMKSVSEKIGKPLSNVADRLKSLASKTKDKAGELGAKVPGRLEEIMQKAKTGGSKLAERAKQFVDKTKESLN